MAVMAEFCPVDLLPVNLYDSHHLVRRTIGLGVQVTSVAGDKTIVERKGLGTAEQLPVPPVDVAGMRYPVEGTGLATSLLVANVAGVVDCVLKEEVFTCPIVIHRDFCVATFARIRLDVRIQDAV
jgi:hypothetical protein